MSILTEENMGEIYEDSHSLGMSALYLLTDLLWLTRTANTLGWSIEDDNSNRIEAWRVEYARSLDEFRRHLCNLQHQVEDIMNAEYMTADNEYTTEGACA